MGSPKLDDFACDITEDKRNQEEKTRTGLAKRAWVG